MEEKHTINNLEVNSVPEKVSVQKEPIMEGELTGYPSIDRPWLKYYDKEVIDLELPKMTVYDYMHMKNLDNMDATALNYLGVNIKYKTLFKKIDEVAKSLTAMGLKKGDVITSCLVNMPESVYLIYAANKLGIVIDLIDPFVTHELMDMYCKRTNSKYVFTIDVAYNNVKDLPKTTNVEKIILASPLESNPVIKRIYQLKNSKQMKKVFENDDTMNWKEFVASGKGIDTYKVASYEKDMPFALVHTGGTTGIPKGALLSGDNVNSTAFQFEHSPLEMHRGESALNLMPPFAAYGLCNGMHTHLCCGMKLILIPTYEPNKIVDQLLKYKPNRIACAPAHYVHISESEKLRKTDLSFLHHPIVGGDTLNTKLEGDLNTLFLSRGCKDKIAKGYGLSETASGVTVCVNNKANKLGSSGIPLPKNILSCFKIDDGETECKYNEEGEICVCSPNNMLGYYNMEEETSNALKLHKDGKVWFHTGDLGYIDEDGSLYIKGRLKRMIIQYNGLKSNPFEAEREVLKHELVNNVVVVGARDFEHDQGQLPVAFIQLENGVECDTEKLKYELHANCERNITYYSVPVDFVFIEDYPRTPIGKIDYKKLTEIYEENYNKENIIKQKELKF